MTREKEIAENIALRDELKAHWQLEKDLISSIREMKGTLENLKTEADNYERKGDLGKVAEIRYGRIIDLEKQIEEKSKKLAKFARIQILKDGPAIISGNFILRDSGRKKIHLETEKAAICRCGASHKKPLCDGTHLIIGFKD
ncbi:MAG: CDGSH iron-sulfur domain-containing protein [Bacteroidales bacterium]